jgi:hypothetical protein
MFRGGSSPSIRMWIEPLGSKLVKSATFNGFSKQKRIGYVAQW